MSHIRKLEQVLNKIYIILIEIFTLDTKRKRVNII